MLISALLLAHHRGGSVNKSRAAIDISYCKTRRMTVFRVACTCRKVVVLWRLFSVVKSGWNRFLGAPRFGPRDFQIFFLHTGWRHLVSESK